jgi:tol-pal system protein YbgF
MQIVQQIAQRLNRRISENGRTQRLWNEWPVLLVAAAMAGLLGGCATEGDLLRLREQVAEHHMSNRSAPDPFSRIAKLAADVDAMRQEIRALQGELELARKEATNALEEVRRTRLAVAQNASKAAKQSELSNASAGAEAGGDGVAAGGLAENRAGNQNSALKPDEELSGYQRALDAWRADEFKVCIERFTGFLQIYPTSDYADDAAYWLADCTYQNDEFKRAVVRFNAVVSVYPESPKAPDALYRQGESLLKLGPKFHEAARTVFKRVQKDYPDSERSVEAAQQLKRLGPRRSG